MKELAEEIESCGYTSYQALIEEIQGIKISNEYVQEAGKDKNHYLRKQVAVMESLAPKLKNFEKLFIDQKRFLHEQGEIQKFLKATIDDLQRLRIRERYLLNQSLGSFGVANASQDCGASDNFDFE